MRILSLAATALSLATSTACGARSDLLVGAPASKPQGTTSCTGPITFVQASVSPVGKGPSSLTVADFDGDGKLDVATADHDGDTVSVLLGRGDGTFDPATILPVGNLPNAIVSGAFAGGVQSLAVTCGGDSDVNVLLGHGDGTFAAASTVPAGGSSPSPLAVADFGGDGILDLAIGDVGTHSVEIDVGQGDGTFALNGSLSVDLDPIAGPTIPFLTPSALAAVQFGSEIPDQPPMLVIAMSGPGASYRVGTSGTNLPSPSGPDFAVGIAAVALADSERMAAVIVFASGLVVVLKGAFDEKYEQLPPFVVGDTLSAVATGDLNCDGKVDLVAAAGEASEIVVLDGKGDGTFEAPQHFPAGASPTSIALGDFDGDGRLDVALTHDDTVSVLLNRPAP